MFIFLQQHNIGLVSGPLIFSWLLSRFLPGLPGLFRSHSLTPTPVSLPESLNPGLRMVLSLFLLLLLPPAVSGRPCRRVCVGDVCAAAVWRPATPFAAAAASCRRSGGELLALRTPEDRLLLDGLGLELPGSLWAGPSGACGATSGPPGGATSGPPGGATSGPPGGAPSGGPCPPLCVSLLDGSRWEGRNCSDLADGFVCYTPLGSPDAVCPPSGGETHAVAFPGPDGCRGAPCQHTCVDLPGGYLCSCFQGYAPDARAPGACRPHCDRPACAAACEGPDTCVCPPGYVLSDHTCLDIDECQSNWCPEGCLNTFGGFICTPHAQATPLSPATPLSQATPPPLREASAPAGGGVLLWVWVLLAAAVLAAVLAVRHFVRRRARRRRTEATPPTPAGDENVRQTSDAVL